MVSGSDFPNKTKQSIASAFHGHEDSALLDIKTKVHYFDGRKAHEARVAGEVQETEDQLEEEVNSQKNNNIIWVVYIRRWIDVSFPSLISLYWGDQI